jgi:hypothetical protein
MIDKQICTTPSKMRNRGNNKYSVKQGEGIQTMLTDEKLTKTTKYAILRVFYLCNLAWLAIEDDLRTLLTLKSGEF